MKKLDIFATGIGIVNIVLFFQFVSIAERAVGINYILQKRPISLTISVLLACCVSYVLFNLSLLLKCIEENDETKYKKIIMVFGRNTLLLLSLFLITTILQNFFSYR